MTQRLRMFCLELPSRKLFNYASLLYSVYVKIKSTLPLLVSSTRHFNFAALFCSFFFLLLQLTTVFKSKCWLLIISTDYTLTEMITTSFWELEFHETTVVSTFFFVIKFRFHQMNIKESQPNILIESLVFFSP